MNRAGDGNAGACRNSVGRSRARLAVLALCAVSLIAPAALADEPRRSREEPRDPNAYSDGYDKPAVPGLEKADRIAFWNLVGDELEPVAGNGRIGAAWDVYGSYGPDTQKVWVRSEGGVEDGTVDYTTSAEALWWRALGPFWATLLGVRQDLGPGWLTYAAFGVEGLAPYWVRVEATAYVGRDGTLAARVKGFYDLLLTNRLILTPELEMNAYSKAQPERAIGAGLSNIELAVRLRYEVVRKFAPYVGVDWDRALLDTVDERRAKDEPVSASRLVLGVRLWW